MTKKILETDRLVLRAPIAADARKIFELYGTDDEAVKYLTWKKHKSVEDAEKFIKSVIKRNEYSQDIIYSIYLKDGRFIGMVDFRLQDTKAIFGVVLGREYWRKGYMSEAINSVIDFLFKNTKILAIEAFCDYDNIASAKLMEKVGLILTDTEKYVIHPNISSKKRKCKYYRITKNA